MLKDNIMVSPLFYSSRITSYFHRSDAAMAKPSFFLSLIIFIILLSNVNGMFTKYEKEELSWWLDEEIKIVQSSKKCDVTSGKWYYDQSYPLYDSNCPYLSSAVTCKKNGRPDTDYEKWRWKPHGCTIPRFDALGFLGRMRRKRVMLVGDSIMRNQWESLVCLVQSVIPSSRKTGSYNEPTITFHALDFETSIEFCWAPFLVELNKGSRNKKILHLDLIEDNAKYWRGAQVLVFDSAHWWTHSDKWSSWDLVMEGNKVYRTINPMIAYEQGLKTWSKWVELNLDPRITRVFFRSMSPRDNGWKCHNQREPLENSSRAHVPEQLVVLQEVLRRTRFPVHLQNITSMSALRRDGHPSVYAGATQRAGQTPSDCSHWCLLGVPDTWNEILNAQL